MGDFQSDLPTCTWLEWRSPQAQAAWAPWITQCRNAFRKIEILSVISGYRRAAIVMCSPEWAAAVQPPRKAPPFKVVQLQSPTSSHGRSSPARNVSYAIASGEYIDTLVAAWGDGGDGTDHETIGELLGFPRCCQDSFRKICVERRCKDPMWRIALNSASGVLERTATVSGHDEANVMLWALGIRAVCHRPCSFYCDATAEIGRGLLAIGAAHGLLEEVGRIRYMLSSSRRSCRLRSLPHHSRLAHLPRIFRASGKAGHRDQSGQLCRRNSGAPHGFGRRRQAADA